MPDELVKLCSCGIPLKGHLKCPSCGSYAGPGHLLQNLELWREKNLCPKCIKRWQALEKQMGIEINYSTFTNPLDLKEDRNIEKEDSIARRDGKRQDYRTL
jgi:hypothetical protein